jgi:hypothetical protein
MPLFALTPHPATIAAPDWAGSTHCGPCYVVAATERRARVHAANAFLVRGARTPGGLLLPSPWTCPRLVAAEQPIGPGHLAAARSSGRPLPEGTVLVPVDPHDARGACRVWVPGSAAA